MEEKSVKQILNEAADLLEEEGRWGQKRYFFFQEADSSSPACVMCAHGAIAYCGNPVVRDRVLRDATTATALAADADVDAATTAATAAAAVATTTAAKTANLSVLEYIRQNHQCYGKNAELAYAHYLAAKAGLTFSFNDTPGRTKQEVINKLREAANLS